jgi:hypothetical protein
MKFLLSILLLELEAAVEVRRGALLEHIWDVTDSNLGRKRENPQAAF